MKLFSVSVHPSKALHLSPIIVLCVHVCVQQTDCECTLIVSICNIYRQVVVADSRIHRTLPQVSLWANPNCMHRSWKQSTKEIYNPVTNYDTVIKLLLCANKHSCLILIIHEILTMLRCYLKKNVNIMKRIMRRRRKAGNYKILKNHKSEKEAGGVRGGKHAANWEWRGKKTLKKTYGDSENKMSKEKRSSRVIGQALMKIDSSFPCPDKQESPITTVTPMLSITAGWQVLHWHESRAHAASATASPY